jgi:hypothetical protein
MATAVPNETAMSLFAHPNDFDRKRIERALKARKRYRYVTPGVVAVSNGYRIEAPCCSRNIDPNGGIVDVALLLHDEEGAVWQLFPRGRDVGIPQQSRAPGRTPGLPQCRCCTRVLAMNLLGIFRAIAATTPRHGRHRGHRPWH